MTHADAYAPVNTALIETSEDKLGRVIYLWKFCSNWHIGFQDSSMIEVRFYLNI